MTIPADIVHYLVAALLFLVGSIFIGFALSPPGDQTAEAKLFAAAVFVIAIGLIVGLRP